MINKNNNTKMRTKINLKGIRAFYSGDAIMFDDKFGCYEGSGFIEFDTEGHAKGAWLWLLKEYKEMNQTDVYYPRKGQTLAGVILEACIEYVERHSPYAYYITSGL